MELFAHFHSITEANGRKKATLVTIGTNDFLCSSYKVMVRGNFWERFFFLLLFSPSFLLLNLVSSVQMLELSLTCESWMKNSKERFFRLASSLYWTRFLAQQYYVVSVASFFLLKTFLSSYFNFQFFFLEFHNGYLCLLEWILFNVYEFNAK